MQISEKQDQVFQSETLHIGEDDLNTHLRKIKDVLKIVCGGTDMDIRSHTMSAKVLFHVSPVPLFLERLCSNNRHELFSLFIFLAVI